LRLRCSFIALAAIATCVSGSVWGMGSVWASTITIGPSKDTTTFQDPANNSSGAGNGLFAGTNGDSSPRRALIAFDVAGNVPSGATITGAQLTLVLGQVAGMGGVGSGVETATIELHKLSADWGEGVNQKEDPPTDGLNGQGQGAPANDGDATWNARFYSATTPTLWATPGGDFSAAASASLSIGTDVGDGYIWGSTAGMVSDVQSWLNTPSSNFGWIMVNTDETDVRTFRAFYSRDAATDHPQLQISFTLLRGDFNQDGHVNAADIPAMMAALTNLQSYKTTERLTDPQLFLDVADVNDDGVFNNADLQALLGDLKSGLGSVNSISEPNSFVLAFMAVGMQWLVRRVRLRRTH
jgi:hypothetical protein